METKPIRWGWACFFVAGAMLLLLDTGKFAFPSFNILKPTKPTAVTFVYEKSAHPIPDPVMAAFDKWNREGIVATAFDQDTLDGDEAVPDQYKVPLAAATTAGLPALVVTSGDTVIKTVKNPTTEEQVAEALK